MNEKMQEMWDNAHDIPRGAFVPEGTVLAQLDPMGPFGEAEINYFVTHVSEYWMGSPDPEPIRSAEPLPDPDDTGILDVEATSTAVLVRVEHTGYYSLTEDQARNLARKLTEAIDGN